MQHLAIERCSPSQGSTSRFARLGGLIGPCGSDFAGIRKLGRPYIGENSLSDGAVAQIREAVFPWGADFTKERDHGYQADRTARLRQGSPAQTGTD
jgi:hypothetical protein